MGLLDPSLLNDPNTTDFGGLLGDPNAGLFDQNWLNSIMQDPGLAPLIGGGQVTFYEDSQNPGVPMTLEQVRAIDPSFNPEGAMSQTPTGMNSGQQQNVTGIGSGSNNFQQGPADQLNPQQISKLAQVMGVAPGVITALAGLGMLGGAASALFGSGNKPGAATSTSTTQSSALTNPAVQGLLGSPGSNASGSYAGGGGLLGAAGQGAANLQGSQGLLQQQIGSIPQLNPQIQAAIGQNALGFSQGNVPTLNSPQAQSYFQNMLGGQNAAVDYQTGNSLDQAMQSLRSRGFAGGSEIFREGAPAAAMGPIVAQANAQKAMNLGNVNAQQLQYATQLPQIGSQLNSQQLGQQGVPFSAYTTAAQTQGGLPIDLMSALMKSSGSSTNTSSMAAQPNLVQTLGQIAPLLGAAGGGLYSPPVSGQGQQQPGLYSTLSSLFG